MFCVQNNNNNNNISTSSSVSFAHKSSISDVGLHTGARANVVLLTYLLTYCQYTTSNRDHQSELNHTTPKKTFKVSTLTIFGSDTRCDIVYVGFKKHLKTF